MARLSDYSEAEVEACSQVLLEVMTILGEFRDGVVVVGGNVPRLLIENPTAKHPGTLDIDLALDSGVISNDTYQTIVRALTSRGYYQKEGGPPHQFHRDVQLAQGEEITVHVDLLSGEYGGTRARHRHQRIQDAVARKARGSDLVFHSAVEVLVTGCLPGGAENSVTLRVAEIGSFLVMKGMALWDRKSEKDAYDIYYCCRNYPGGLTALAESVGQLVSNRLAREGLGKIKRKFGTVDGIGPSWVADFLEIADPEEREVVKREAYELVNGLLDKLDIEPFTD